MQKKIRIYTLVIIAVVLAISAVLIYIVDGNQIDNVKAASVTQSTSSSISLKWKKVHKAQGYKIYNIDEKEGKADLIAEVKGGENCSYEMKDVVAGTVYRIKVTAYKTFGKKLIESQQGEVFTAYSMPQTPEIAVSSENEGLLNVKWDEQENAEGYLVEYSKNEDFSDSKTTETEKNRFVEKELKPKDTYFVRCCSYITVDGKLVYSQWSETKSTEIRDRILMDENIDPKKPMIALTFDDGPGYYDGNNSCSTERILDVLEKHNAKATFFMCASRINSSNEDLLKREVKLGCELGNHTYDHKNYGKNVKPSDISKCSNAIKEVTGEKPTVFRCPGGIMSKEIQRECEKENMPIAYWSVDTEDWKSKNAKSVVKIATSQAFDGAIILMHDIYPSTADAVEKIVPMLIKEGYQLVTVSELIAYKNDGEAPKAGQQYVNATKINNNT